MPQKCPKKDGHNLHTTLCQNGLNHNELILPQVEMERKVIKVKTYKSVYIHIDIKFS